MDTASMSPSGPAAPVGAIPPGAGDGDVAARPSRRSRLLRFAVLALIWLLTTLVVGSALFFSSERSTELAGHDAVVRPMLDRHAVLATGPVLPDVRIGIDSPLGVEITLGKTDAASTEELVSRYALIVSNPEAQADKVVDLVVGMAGVAYLRGAAVGLVPVLLYVLLGPAGRAHIRRDVRTLRPRVLVAGLLVVAIVTASWQPWRDDDAQVAEQGDWTRLDDYVGDEVDLPDEAGVVELRANAATDGSKKLVDSVVDTWAKSQVFYDKAAEEAKNLNLRTARDGETVAVLVTDRHDNVGMDRVARALADAVGATAVLDGGDDTSTGKKWEAFSLDSLNKEFKDFDRWAVTGNHDHGSFVGDHLAELGWQVLDGEVVEGPGGGLIMGVPDPRSSGLGSWRDAKGVTFAEAQQTVADLACEAQDAGERINTLLVHDPNLGKVALERGCTDLVVGGHHHVDKGPTQVDGENGQSGYTFTNGTTGGAAYAIAVGSKPKRDAQITLITYDDTGRPVGLQLVTLRTDGKYEVDPFVAFARPAEA